MIKQILTRIFISCLCIFSALQTFSQNKNITGSVSDNNGSPLSGATVYVRGTSTTAVTDANGKFSLDVPSTSKSIVISYVGKQTREVPLGSNATFKINLADGAAATLSDVVVIGYGTAKRANLTTAQSSVSAKDIDRTVNTTLEQAIQGRASGVYITQNSGQPGGGISINIRGVSSINGSTEPLYVIDGVQIEGQSVSFGAQSSSNPLAGINPADFDNIQILQGPSATAIYGSRATNGVILITTKRGKSGEAKLTYNFQHSEQTPPKRLEVMDLRQYAIMVKEFHDIAGGQTQAEFLDPSLLGKGTDWQDELFKTVPMNKHSLSMSGGNDKTNYFMSGEYLNQEGIALGSGFERYSFRVNLDNKPREWVNIGLNFSANQTEEDLSTSQENIISNALQNTPQVPVKNLDGSWGGGDLINGANQFAPVNPIAIATLTTNRNKRRQILGGVNLAFNVVKGLVLRTSFNTNISYGNSTYYIPKYKIGWAENATARLSEGTSTSTYWNLNQFLEYSNKFGKHDVQVMAGHEAQSSAWKNIGASKTGFLTNDILDLRAGDDLTAGATGGSGPWAMESYLGRVSYNYDNRYVVVGTLRRDGSSNFGSDNRWGLFPSVSAAWRVSEEKFFNVPFISSLKLRLETGLTGSQGNGGIYSPLIASATPTGTGFLPGQYANQGLKWEETNTDNIGINLGLLKDRIQIEFDYYIKKTNNLLMTNPLPWYMGSNGNGAVSAPTVNIGDLQNKGWGLTIITTNISNKNFKWESNLNLSAFKTVIKKFYSEAAFVERSSWWLDAWTQRSAVGNAPWLFRGFIEDGLFQSIDEINNSAVPVDNNGQRYPTDQQNGIWVGDVKYRDISGPNGKPDGIINIDDQTYIGNPWPKLFGGFTNTFSYKNFDLSMLITSTYGNDIYNYMARVNTNPNNINLSRNLLLHAMEYAKPVTKTDGTTALSNPATDVARISYGPNANFTTITDKWVEDGSFIRIKNISLSYNVPASLLSKQKIVKGVRATAGVQNIATITNYSGYDPEVGSYVGRDSGAGNQAIGLDFGRYPLTPIYTFNVSVNF